VSNAYCCSGVSWADRFYRLDALHREGLALLGPDRTSIKSMRWGVLILAKPLRRAWR